MNTVFKYYMELYGYIHEMFKPSFLKYSIYFKTYLSGKQIQDKKGYPSLGQKYRQK